MAGRGEVLIRILGDAGQLDGVLGATQGKLGALGKSFGGLGTVVVATGLAIAGTLIKIGSDFNEANNIIRRETGATGPQLATLKKDFDNVVSAVPAKFNAAADAVSKVKMVLGLSGAPLDRMAEQMLELNRITGGVFNETFDASTHVLQNWMIPAAQMPKALDEIFKASQLAGVGVSTIMGQLNTGGAILRELGFSFQQSTGMIAMFDKAGLNTDQILAGMRMGLKTFAKAHEEPQQAFQRLVKEIQDAPTRIQGTADALKVFGTRSGAGLAEAIQSGRIDYGEFMKQIAGSSDTIRKAGRDTMSMHDSWQLVKNQVFVAVKPIAKEFFDGVRSGMTWISEHMDGIKGGFKEVGKAIEFAYNHGGVKPVVEGLKTVYDAFSQKTPMDLIGGTSSQKIKHWVQTSVKAPMEEGITWVGKFWDAWKKPAPIAEYGLKGAELQAFHFQQTVAGIRKTVEGVFSAIGKVVHQFAQDWTNNTDKLGVGIPKIKKILEQIWETFKAYLSALAAEVKFAVGIILFLWNTFGETLLKYLKIAWLLILDIVKNALDILHGIFDIIGGIFSGDWDKVWKGVKEVFSGAWGLLKDAVKLGIDSIELVFDLAKDGLKKAWGLIWDGLKAVVEAVWSGIETAVRFGINMSIIDPINDVISFLDGIHIDIPEVHIPFIGSVGGGTFSFPHIPTIPRLAAGGVLGVPTLAVVGDAASREIVTPEDLMREIVRDELSGGGRGGDTHFHFYGVKDGMDAVDRYAWQQRTSGR